MQRPTNRPSVRRAEVVVAALLALTFQACSDPVELPTSAPAVANGGKGQVQVVLPKNAGQGLVAAAEDFQEAVAKITGTPALAPHKGSVDGGSAAVLVVVTIQQKDTPLGQDSHSFAKATFDSAGKFGLVMRADSERGAMWGLYSLVERFGARYIHPEESFFPENPGQKLPWDFSGQTVKASFGARGLHEHTQHPTPPSDFLMRQDDPAFRGMASRYLRWLARNRQSTFTFHMLKTVPLKEWVPYYKGIVDEARALGIEPGLVVSFADQQQNNFKLIREDRVDGGGKILADDAQIKLSLDELMKTGLRRFTFQIGTSEFTKPKDSRVLSWIETARKHLQAATPAGAAHIWIHTTCSLHDDDGGYFYHLPLKSDASVGAWVHTTMFYDLDNPAPVYDCDNFHQQKQFIEKADGKRDLIYFPETAWWLGFDNNMPLMLPITGWSRAHDIVNVLAKHKVDGHITFTTGREWGYWMYDHYVMAATWDRTLTWQKYLTDNAHVLGPNGAAMMEVIGQWAQLQKKHFYDTNPLIYFYLAGELAQDEIGEQAGILARRPKLAFHKVLSMTDAAFSEWQKDDFELLQAMEKEYSALLKKLEAAAVQGGEKPGKLAMEQLRGYWLHVARIQHAILLYGAVKEMRPWAVELASAATPDGAIKDKAKAAAQAKIDAAVKLTKAAIAEIHAQEKDYRYPAAILSAKKPKTLTSYPFGYLEQTHTGHFWTRRDEQAQKLLDKTFGDFKEAWKSKPAPLFFTDKSKTKLLDPDHPTASGVLANFMPRLLWGFGKVAGGGAQGAVQLRVAQDSNNNGLPDGDSEQAIDGQVDEKAQFSGKTDAFVIQILDSAGNEQGTLSMLDASFLAQLEVKDGAVVGLKTATVTGSVGSKALLDIMFAVGGIDEQGASALVKAVFGVPAGQPLPKLLPFSFAFTFEPVN